MAKTEIHILESDIANPQRASSTIRHTSTQYNNYHVLESVHPKNKIKDDPFYTAEVGTIASKPKGCLHRKSSVGRVKRLVVQYNNNAPPAAAVSKQTVHS